MMDQCPLILRPNVYPYRQVSVWNLQWARELPFGKQKRGQVVAAFLRSPENGLKVLSSPTPIPQHIAMTCFRLHFPECP